MRCVFSCIIRVPYLTTANNDLPSSIWKRLNGTKHNQPAADRHISLISVPWHSNGFRRVDLIRCSEEKFNGVKSGGGQILTIDILIAIQVLELFGIQSIISILFLNYYFRVLQSSSSPSSFNT